MSRTASDLVMDSWRPATKKAYNSYIKQWHQYTELNDIKNPTHIDLMNFLGKLFSNGASYNTINLARSAIAAYLNSNIGKHPLVCRLVKGVFENRPALPRYSSTWNVDTVLDMLGRWNSASLSLKDLTLKTLMLLALVSGQRCQTLFLLNVPDIKFDSVNNSCTIYYTSLLKQSRPGHHLPPLFLNRFHNRELCVLSNLEMYIDRTKELRTSEGLFIITMKPYTHAAKDTIAGWITSVLELAGIDTSTFTAHSSRSAATSAALSRNMPINSILSAAGWSSESVFLRFYNRSTNATKKPGLSQSLLDSYLNK